MGMKAAVLVTPGTPLEIISGLSWNALTRGQVLVKLAFSGVCHSQLMEVRGLRGADAYLPHLLGHEGSGQVIDVGEGVTKVRIGDFVVVGWLKGLGLESGGTRYFGKKGVFNAGAATTFNEFAVVSENRLILLPDYVPLDVAVLFGCALPTGSGIVFNEIKPPPGSTIAIFGLGGIGLSALMAAQTYETKEIIAVDISEEKLLLARDFGATHTINYSTGDSLERVFSLTDGRGVDFSVEASGVAAVIETAFKSVRRNGGLCVFASHPKSGATIQLDPYDLICGRQIRGSWGGASNPDTDTPRLFELFRAGKLPLRTLISKRYSLKDINSALDDLESGSVLRPLIEIDPSLQELRG